METLEYKPFAEIDFASTARPAREGNYDVQSFLGSGAGSSCTVAPENLEISERMCLILVS
jgi:hypothetical protein